MRRVGNIVSRFVMVLKAELVLAVKFGAAHLIVEVVRDVEQLIFVRK